MNEFELIERFFTWPPRSESVALGVGDDAALINPTPGCELVVSVEDYGPGLPDGASERVFAKLQRGSLEGARGGVGLGLAICRSIVVLHGGRVWAEQLDGGGSAFRFTLPVEEAPQVPAEAAA